MYCKQFFWTKLLTLGILFSTVVRAAVAAKLVTLGISPLTSFILALREALTAKLIKLGILSSIFLIVAFYTSFLTTSFFTKINWNSLLKSTGTGTNLSTIYLSTNLTTSDLKLAKLIFLAKDDVCTAVAFFKSVFVT